MILVRSACSYGYPHGITDASTGCRGRARLSLQHDSCIHDSTAMTSLLYHFSVKIAATLSRQASTHPQPANHPKNTTKRNKYMKRSSLFRVYAACLENSARDCDPLLLPSRKLNPLVPDFCVIAVGEGADKVVGVSFPGCLLHLVQIPFSFPSEGENSSRVMKRNSAQ